MSDLKEQLEKHEVLDQTRHQETFDEIRFLRENHVAHIETDVAGIKTGMAADRVEQAKQGTDIWWIKTIGGTLIAGIVTIILKLFTGR